MSFLEPDRLWYLLVIPALLAAYLILQWRRRRYALRFSNLSMLAQVAPRRPSWRRHVAALLVMVTIGLLVTAFARPSEEVRVQRERATIVLAIDVSLSMNSDDVEPTRLEAARMAATRFVEGLPPAFNVSVVAYAGTASILVPPTTDRSLVTRAIRGLELDESTATGEAIFTALDALKQVPPDPENPGEAVPARLVLLADGAQNVGRSIDEGADAALEGGVPIYSIAFGTPYGLVEIEGEMHPVPVDEESMRSVAEITGGESYVAETGAELDQVYADIDSSVGYTTEEEEVTGRFVGYALVGALAAAAVSLFFFGRLP